MTAVAIPLACGSFPVLRTASPRRNASSWQWESPTRPSDPHAPPSGAAPAAEGGPAAVDRETLQRDHVIARLRIISAYQAGWDGKHSIGPRREAVEDAMDFVANLSRDIAFNVSPGPDGAIHLAVRTAAGRAILTFEGDGHVDLYVSRGDLPYSDPKTLTVPTRIGADRAIMDTLDPIIDS